MTRIGWFALALGLCSLCAGCPKKSTQDPEKGSKPADKPAVAETFERHLLAMATCELKGKGISLSCKPHQTMLKSGMDQGDLSVEQRHTIGLKYLRHERPMVRYVAADLAEGSYRSRPDALPKLIKAAQEEDNPWVLGELLDGLPVGKEHPETGALLLKNLDHAHEDVRVESVRSLARREGKDVPGAVEKLIDKIERDPSVEVRQAACYYAGRTGAADKLVPVYAKLDRRTLEPRTLRLCMEGLNSLWTSTSRRDPPPSEAAYKLSLALLRETPRTRDWPTGDFVGDFDRVPRGDPAWYQREDVAAALAEISIDDKAKRDARSEAVEVLAKLKVAAQLRRVKAQLAGKTDPDSKAIAPDVDKALSAFGPPR